MNVRSKVIAGNRLFSSCSPDVRTVGFSLSAETTKGEELLCSFSLFASFTF